MLPVIEESRLRVYYLSYRHLLSILHDPFKNSTVLQWPVIEGPPEGSIVHHVFQDPIRRGFGVVVTHESFPEVDDSAELPRADTEMSMQIRALKIVGNAVYADMDHLTTEQLQHVRDESIRLLSQRTL